MQTVFEIRGPWASDQPVPWKWLWVLVTFLSTFVFVTHFYRIEWHLKYIFLEHHLLIWWLGKIIGNRSLGPCMVCWPRWPLKLMLSNAACKPHCIPSDFNGNAMKSSCVHVAISCIHCTEVDKELYLLTTTRFPGHSEHRNDLLHTFDTFMNSTPNAGKSQLYIYIQTCHKW